MTHEGGDKPSDANSADGNATPLPTGRFGDAILIGTLSDAALDTTLVVGYSPKGRQTGPGKWKNLSITLGQLLAHKLSKHVAGEKDGECLLQGEAIDGERRAQAMRANDLLILDLDTGDDIEQVKARLVELGRFAVIWTTHSHLKPITEVNKDAVMKWASTEEPTIDHAAGYLRDIRQYQPHILKDAKLLSTQHTKEGVMLRVQHQPLPKLRVLTVLAESFVFAERAGGQRKAIEEWKERYAGFANLIGAYYDRSCVDPSRLMYLPRHPEGSTNHSITIIAGKSLDLETIERVKIGSDRAPKNEYEAAANDMGADRERKDYATAGLLPFVARHGAQFDAADFLMGFEPENHRGDRTSGPGHIHRCPFDDDHSNAGDGDDRGFYVINGTESGLDSGYQMHCSHNACADRDRADFLDAFAVAHELEVSDLAKWCVELVGDGETAEGPKLEKPAADLVSHLLGRIEDEVKRNDRETVETIAKEILKYEWKTDKFGLATLIHALAYRSKYTKSEIRNLLTTLDSASVSSNPQSTESDVESLKVAADLEKAMKGYNKKYAFVTVGSQGRILVAPKKKGERIALLGIETFRIMEAPNKVYIDTPDGMKKTSVAREWLEWGGRRDYKNGIVFEPGRNVEDTYNLWQGFPIEGKPGAWSRLQDHIFHVICGDSDQYYAWLMMWMAHAIQYPDIKPGSAVALRGKRGTGKTKLWEWYAKLFGVHALVVSQRQHVTGNFNAHQKGILFMCAEEAVWGGDAEAAGHMKHLITSDEMVMEQKGVDPIRMSNYIRLGIATNERWTVPASLDDERRFFVLDVTEERKQDLDYFAAIDDQMKAGGLEAMMYTLATFKPEDHDLNWDMLRKPPRTAALVDQALEGLQPYEKFFVGMVEDGGLEENRNFEIVEVVLNEDKPAEVYTSDIRKHYNQYLFSVGGSSRFKIGDNRAFGTAAKKYLNVRQLGFVRAGGRTMRKWEIPSLVELRAYYLDRFGMKIDEGLSEPVRDAE